MKRRQPKQSDLIKPPKVKHGKINYRNLNDTNTAIHTANLSFLFYKNDTHLVSDEKNTFRKLLHVKSNSRLTVLQYIRNKIDLSNKKRVIVRDNLDIIIPYLCNSLFDQSPKIRTFTIIVFSKIVSILEQDITPMYPYIKLLMTFILTGFNSLDEDVRFDACRVIELLCRTVGQRIFDVDTIACHGPEGGIIISILQAYSRVLEDSVGKYSSIYFKENYKNNYNNQRLLKTERNVKINTAKSLNKRVMNTLQSLNIFLDVWIQLNESSSTDIILENNIDIEDSMNQHLQLLSTTYDDIIFCPGATICNSLVWRRSFFSFPEYFHSDLLSLIQSKKIKKYPKYLESYCADWSCRDSVTNLLMSLRDRFVEVMQFVNPEVYDNNPVIYLDPSNSKLIGYIISSFRKIWKGFIVVNMSYLWSSKSLLRVFICIQKLLLQVFPLEDNNAKSVNKRLYEIINMNICCTLLEVGGTISSNNSTEVGLILNNVSENYKLWFNTVFSYLFPKIQEQISSPTSSVKFTTIGLFPTIIAKLLQDSANSHSLSQSLYGWELWNAFSDVFFSSNLYPSICLSSCGRDAVIILSSLLSRQFCTPLKFVIESESKILEYGNHEWTKKLLFMASVLPLYLYEWKGSYSLCTEKLLSSLLCVVRHYDFEKLDGSKNTRRSMDDAYRVLGSALHQMLPTLFQSNCSCFRKGITNNEKSSLSIYELYTRKSKHLLIGIIGHLKYPSKKLLFSLADICARMSLRSKYDYDSNGMADYAISIIHRVRRTIPMKLYLSFLIKCTGIDILIKGRVKMKTNDLSQCILLTCENRIGEVSKEALFQNLKKEKKVNLKMNIPGEKPEIDLLMYAMKWIYVYDIVVVRSCQYFMQCDSRKVLSMLEPILIQWLSLIPYGASLEITSQNRLSNELSLNLLIIAKAAISIITCCINDILVDRSYVYNDKTYIFHTVSISVLIPKLEKLVYNVIFFMLKTHSLLLKKTSYIERTFDKFHCSLILTPIKDLLRSQPYLIKQLLRTY